MRRSRRRWTAIKRHATRSRVQNLAFEQSPIPDNSRAGKHEQAVAAIVHRLGKLWCDRDVRFQHFEDKETVFLDQARVDELAFKICVALFDQRRADFLRWECGEFERRELVNIATGSVSDLDDRRCEVDCRDVDHAFPALTDHLEAVILVPDKASDEGRFFAHDHVPTHGHDVAPGLPARTHEDDGAWLEEPADVGDGKVFLPIRGHSRSKPMFNALNVNERIAYISRYETLDLDHAAFYILCLCADATGEYFLHRRARRENRRDRRGGAIALVRRRPDRPVGGGRSRSGGDAEFRRSIIRTARP